MDCKDMLTMINQRIEKLYKWKHKGMGNMYLFVLL